MNQYWIMFCLLLLAGAFGSGMYTEHKFDLVAQLWHTEAQNKANTKLAEKGNAGLAVDDAEIDKERQKPTLEVPNDQKITCPYSAVVSGMLSRP